MKSKKFQYLFKAYISLFSILALISLGLALNYLINNQPSEMFSILKSCSTFIIFLLFGLNYKKIEDWLEVHLVKQKS
ncbi:hypothetical protein D5055_09045 [Acinetobacter radioresistens]|nr:hypothetical protein D5055_09045 [Acinetobacter radioresistens]